MAIAARSTTDRVAAIDWPRIHEDLNRFGCAVVEGLLGPRECAELAALYDDDARFRSNVVMARHGFGSGEYRYFSYPLPGIVADLRTALYPPLANIANDWSAALKSDIRYPPSHAAFIERCHAAGQARPTPL